jgi:diguanylate cyclase (GGDEF)-like protein
VDTLERIGEALDGVGKLTKLMACFAAFAAVAAGERFIATELTLRIFYLLPVAFATWILSERWALLFAMLSTVACAVVDSTHHRLSHGRLVVADAALRLFFYAAVIALLGRLREAQGKLADLARRDPLTGLLNWRGFLEIADREIERSRRYRTPITLVYIDLDHFKQVNDTWGHTEGDRVLTVVARVLGQGRAVDVPARLGGDEFVLLLPNTGVETVDPMVRRMRSRLVESMTSAGWPVTFSFGVASFVDPPESVEAMVRAADASMYELRHSLRAMPSAAPSIG